MLNKGIEFVTPDDTLEEASGKMNRQDVDEMPVFENSMPVGMLSKHDITTRVSAIMDDPKKITVRQVMKHAH
jgi:predicted transcriptional regulator